MKFKDYEIKRNDGTRCRIAVEVYQPSFGLPIQWRFSVSVCAPRKRSFLFIADEWSNEWRSKTPDEFVAERMKYVTSQEVYEAMIVAWEQIKPREITPPTPPPQTPVQINKGSKQNG